MNPRALLHPGIFERTGPLGWFVQGEWERTGPLGYHLGVSFIKEAGNGFEGFLEE